MSKKDDGKELSKWSHPRAVGEDGSHKKMQKITAHNSAVFSDNTIRPGLSHWPKAARKNTLMLAMIGVFVVVLAACGYLLYKRSQSTAGEAAPEGARRTGTRTSCRL